MADGQEKCVEYYRRAWYAPSRPLDNKHGQQFPNTKLPRERRIELWQRFSNGETVQSLSTQYGLSECRVRAIISHFRKVYGT
jgi:hypothetical protein